MPRKRNKEGIPVNAAGEALKVVRLELPPEMHLKLRVSAAKENKSMSAMARELVEDGLKRKEAKGGAK
jgi:plasmid stability protein